MKKIKTQKSNFSVRAFFTCILALSILSSVFGGQIAFPRRSVAAKPTLLTAAPMPNLDGGQAKEYLEQKGLDKSLAEAIEVARYSVNRVETTAVSTGKGVLEAKNPNQEFAAYFSDDGVNLVSRKNGETWNLSLRLSGIGYGSRIESKTQNLKPAIVNWSADKSKIWGTHVIESQNSNFKFQVDEFFENRPDGLEQSFVIQDKYDDKCRKSADEQLKIIINLTGDLQPEISGGGQELVFTKGGELVLRYDKLKSWDANGNELASRMELSGNDLSLVVDEQNAVYPVTIDPTFTQIKKIVAADGGAVDNFGSKIAVSGNTAAIGAIGDNSVQGSVYIFERNVGGANNWSQIKKLTASDGPPNGHFGDSLAFDGDTVVVGSNTAAYIFERNAGGTNNWGEVKILTVELGSTGTFGESLDISENTIIVGFSTNNPKGNLGTAFVYDRDQGGLDNWGLVRQVSLDIGVGGNIAMSGDTAIITSIGAQEKAQIFRRDEGGENNWGRVTSILVPNIILFPTAVGISGDTAVIGGFGGPGVERAYVFGRNRGGPENWGLVKTLTASDGAPGDAFGITVAISDDRIVVGANADDVGSNANQGSAYVFERDRGGPGNWGEVVRITATDGSPDDRFGASVAIDGKTAMAGAAADDTGANIDQGSAYVFNRQNTSWTHEIKQLPENCTVEDHFGGAVAISGDTAIVGATSEDVGANANQGAGYIFERNAGGTNNWGLVKTISALDGEQYDLFGNVVAIDGDRAIVGTYADDTGSNINQGAAYIFERNSGGANNWGQVAKLTASDAADQDWFGWSVGISGSTAIVGALLDDVGANNAQGSAYIFERNAGGLNNWGEVKHVLASDGRTFDTFGRSVDISGNVAIIGSDGDNIGTNANQGSVYILERDNGGAGNWGELKKITASDGASGDQFGVNAAIDGSTIIVGAFMDDIGANNAQGSAYIFEQNTGGANNWGEVKKLIAPDGAASDFFGLNVDVSGGTAIIGALYDQVGDNTFQGSAYIFKQHAGGANNWGQVKKLVASDGAARDSFSSSIAISGDTAFVGAPGDDVDGALNQGSTYVFISNNDAWNQQTMISLSPPDNCGTDDKYGFSVAVAGDTAVIGAPADDIGINIDQGSAYVLERNQGGANVWGLVKLLTASDGAAGDTFGNSVAISGGKIIVGASNDTIGTNTGEGSAYIFERNTGGPNNFGEIKKLLATNGESDDHFGTSVAISDTEAVVGSLNADVGANDDQGEAFVFAQNKFGTNNWGFVTKLLASDGAAMDQLGSSVGISGDTIILGAPGDTEGSAYIFERNTGGANNWGETQKLTASGGAAGDLFGSSVGISGDIVIVGALQAQIGLNAGQGAGYVFGRNSGNNWGQIKKLVANDGAANDEFGTAVSISGDTLIVGSPFDDSEATDQGSAYIFEQNAGGPDNWGQVTKLTAKDAAAFDIFGSAVAVSGDNFLVGAFQADINAPFTQRQNQNFIGVIQQGAGYVFRGKDLAPTAANVQVGGRVLTAGGNGVANARVLLTNTNGEARAAITNSFGFYRFDNVQAGEAYVFSVSHKEHQFAPIVLTVNEEISDLNFTAEN